MSAYTQALSLCEQAQNHILQATQNQQPERLEQALALYQQALDLDVALESPFIGLAYLCLCADDKVMAQRLLDQAERLNPAALAIQEMRKKIKQHRPQQTEQLSPRMIRQLSRLSEQPEKPETSGNAVSRLVTPLQGLLTHSRDIERAVDKAFAQRITPTQAERLFNLLKQLQVGDARAVKPLQQEVARFAPEYQRKISAFAQRLAEAFKR